MGGQVTSNALSVPPGATWFENRQITRYVNWMLGLFTNSYFSLPFGSVRRESE